MDASSATSFAAPDASGWDSFLTTLEHDLAQMMLELSDDTSADGKPPTGRVWTPPSGLGPLPAPLEIRARALLSATSHARAKMATRHLEIGRHLAAVQSVPTAAAARPPVYLDVAG